MKAERRHDLKTNALSRGLDSLPELNRRYGGKVLLGIIALLLVALLIRYRSSTARSQDQQAAASVSNARGMVDQLRSAPFRLTGNPFGLAEMRKQMTGTAETAIQEALDASDEPERRAEAYLTRGDLNWTLANFPEIPGAATQPSLQSLTPRSQFLSQADADYEKAVEEAAATPTNAGVTAASAVSATTISARLGLAAVAENRNDWTMARKHYQDIIDQPNASPAYVQYAKARQSLLTSIQKPVLIGQPDSQPSVVPATTMSSTGPTSFPTTAESTTLPTTEPAATTEPAGTQPATAATTATAPAAAPAPAAKPQ